MHTFDVIAFLTIAFIMPGGFMVWCARQESKSRARSRIESQRNVDFSGR